MFTYICTQSTFNHFHIFSVHTVAAYFSHVSKMLLDKNPSHCLDRSVAVELSVITISFIYVHSREMYKPLRNRVDKYFFLLLHSIMLGDIKTFTNQITFFKVFCLPEIFLMRKITKMNALLKIIHTFKIPIWPNATDA